MAVVLQMDTQNAIAGIFSQIVTEDEGGREMNIREKGIEYISTSLMSMRHKLFLNNPENEKFLLEQIKKVRRERRYSCRKCCITWSMCLSVSHLHILQVLVDVTGEEFETLMDVLSKLKYTSTPDGAKDVVAIISEQAELASEFQVKLSIQHHSCVQLPYSYYVGICFLSLPSSTATRCRIHRSFHHLF